jgi:glycogen operon protein
VFRRRAFFAGRSTNGTGAKDIGWFGPSGEELDGADWAAPTCRTIGVFLNGDEIGDRGPRGEPIVDDSFLVLLHAAGDAVQFALPGPPWAKEYAVMIDTALPGDGDPGAGHWRPATRSPSRRTPW